jgi:hypothetical protein
VKRLECFEDLLRYCFVGSCHCLERFQRKHILHRKRRSPHRVSGCCASRSQLLDLFKGSPSHSATWRSAVLKSTLRAAIHRSSKLRECFPDSAKSPHNPAFGPAIQILKFLPASPSMLPTHQCTPSRCPFRFKEPALSSAAELRGRHAVVPTAVDLRFCES